MNRDDILKAFDTSRAVDYAIAYSYHLTDIEQYKKIVERMAEIYRENADGSMSIKKSALQAMSEILPKVKRLPRDVIKI